MKFAESLTKSTGNPLNGTLNVRSGFGNGGSALGIGANSLSSISSTNKKLFGKFVDGSSKKDRLAELLERTGQYTRFILQQNAHHYHAQQKKAQAKKAGGSGSTANLIEGKTSISKRRLAKSRNINEAEDSESSD